jgi:hypothetical protein
VRNEGWEAEMNPTLMQELAASIAADRRREAERARAAAAAARDDCIEGTTTRLPSLRRILGARWAPTAPASPPPC